MRGAERCRCRLKAVDRDGLRRPVAVDDPSLITSLDYRERPIIRPLEREAASVVAEVNGLCRRESVWDVGMRPLVVVDRYRDTAPHGLLEGP